MKILVLFASLFTAIPAFSAQRVAERYTCTAFNPATGYATIKYSEKARGKTKMSSLWGEKEIRGGRLTYSTSSYSSYPRAVFDVEVAGRPVSVYMDLVRPLKDGCEGQLSEEILTGVTYIPLYGAAFNWWPFSPLVGYTANPFVPVPAGFVPTSIVTCRVVFR